MEIHDEFQRAFEQMKARQREAKLMQMLRDFKGGNLSEDELYKMLFNVPGPQQAFQPRNNLQDMFEDLLRGHKPPQQQGAPKWNSIAEMNEALKKLPKRPAPQPVDPAKRRAEIEHELDIIRGRVPTPKGYKINPARVKSLMAELKALPDA